MATTKGAKEVPIYQIKVTLEAIEPPIRRRLLVPSDITLAGLHDIIQAAFGWWDYHLYQFIVGETYYGVPDPDFGGFLEIHDERKMRLHQITEREGFQFH